MMVELARELQKNDLVHLGRIAEITGLSCNYLSQLAIPLKNAGLIKGVPGKMGGYRLAKSPEKISIAEIVRAVIGPVSLTECVTDPSICNNSTFCEARTVWTIVNSQIQQTLEELTLADLIARNWLSNVQKKHSDMPLLFPDKVMSKIDYDTQLGCPTNILKRTT